MNGKRGISDDFLDDLGDGGLLHPFLDLVKTDRTLDIEIRDDRINIYFRGGNLLRVEEKKRRVYEGWFDVKYKGITKKTRPTSISCPNDVTDWIDRISELRTAMNTWFAKHPKEEREFQQLIVRENNIGKIASATDYFICDIEYANPNGRFDMVAVHWPSSASQRKRGAELELVLIEVKFGDAALTKKAGIVEHVKDANAFLKNGQRVRSLKSEMKTVFNQKRILGLINCKHNIQSFSKEKPRLLFILANHDPASSVLKRELGKLPSSSGVEIQIATSCFMGYGLFDEGIFGLDEFQRRHGRRIHNR